MYLFSTNDVVYTRMKRDTRIETPGYKLIHVRNYTCLKLHVLQIIRAWNHTRYKSYTLQIIRVWNDGISLDDQRHTPVLLSPCNARRNVLRHDRVNLRDVAVKSMRPWRHRTTSLAGRCSVVTQRQSRCSCIKSSGEYSEEHQPTCADNQMYSQAPINLI